MTISPHPEAAKFLSRVEALGTAWHGSFDDELYRFINPAYSKADDIANGAGAFHASGRWNVKGSFRLSYTALEPETALAEALAHVRYFKLPASKALPRVLVSLRLKAKRVVDLRDGDLRRKLRLSDKTIRSLDWRKDNFSGKTAVTQAWGEAFAKSGLEALIVPSAAAPTGANVLVFPGNLLHGSSFEVIDEVKWPAP
jgi:RES domain-containing protein